MAKASILENTTATQKAYVFEQSERQTFNKLVYWRKKESGLNDLKATLEIRRQLCIFFECQDHDDIEDFIQSSGLSSREIKILIEFAPIESGQKMGYFTHRFYEGFAGEYAAHKEEVLSDLGDGNQVTINQYDAQILNTSKMMIVDVDLIGDDVIAPSEEFAIDTLKRYCRDNPLEGWRIYRTAAGLRYICTSYAVDPTKPFSGRLMQLLYADNKYRNLCRFQGTYRARLTPKPWRADFESREFSEALQIARDDQEPFYKAAQFVEKIDNCNGYVLPEFEELVRLHDRKTGALSWLGELA